ncbi:MAG: hypothetical protein O6940_09760, partial [Ignavibacteria bacterium]|nr:hypothetical protein [Ignavibacteria bacterium]
SLAMIHTILLVFCLPVLIRAYFLKRNGRLTNVILIIPLVYIFLVFFIYYSTVFIAPSSEIFKQMWWDFGLLASSLIFGLAYFYGLVRINRLPT